MGNKVKSEQCFSVTSDKRVVVLQAGFKLVTKETRKQLSNSYSKHSSSQGSKCLHEEDTANTNDTLTYR